MLLPFYLHSIYIIFTSFTGYEDGILKLYLIYTFKDNFFLNSGKLDKSGGKSIKKKNEFCRTHRTCFLQLWYYYQHTSIDWVVPYASFEEKKVILLYLVFGTDQLFNISLLGPSAMVLCKIPEMSSLSWSKIINMR